MLACSKCFWLLARLGHYCINLVFNEMPVQQTIYLLSNISFTSYQLNASWGLDSLTLYVLLHLLYKQTFSHRTLQMIYKLLFPIVGLYYKQIRQQSATRQKRKQDDNCSVLLSVLNRMKTAAKFRRSRSQESSKEFKVELLIKTLEVIIIETIGFSYCIYYINLIDINRVNGPQEYLAHYINILTQEDRLNGIPVPFSPPAFHCYPEQKYLRIWWAKALTE